VKDLKINLSIDTNETTTVIVDFIKTYVKNSGCKGVVLGLSGGVDSAVTAVLCKKALGSKNTKCIFLPDETTPKVDYKHHELIVKKFALSCEIKDISSIVKQFSNDCIIKPDKFSLANVKARSRMILLFEYANMTKNLVCGTSNKSEILIGYFTKYGDGGVDIMPIGDLYKTQIWDIARHLKIPEDLIKKPPTAGLWKDQSDEKELKMSYKTLDIILAGLEKKIEISEISKFAEVNKIDVERIRKMRKNSQHKRRSALIPKIGLRTPGLDWRSPIQEG